MICLTNDVTVAIAITLLQDGYHTILWCMGYKVVYSCIKFNYKYDYKFYNEYNSACIRVEYDYIKSLQVYKCYNLFTDDSLLR